MNLNLLKTFIKVAELGSYTKASQVLNQPKSRVSRAISRLEEETQVQLIKRTTRSLSLTEAGKQLFHETRELINNLQSKVDHLASDTGELSGIISLSAPIDLGENVLSGLLCEFSRLHPNVSYRVLLSDSYVDLTAYDIDLALRVGNLKDSSLMQKKLSSTHLLLVASKEYCQLMGMPKAYKDLKGHKLLSFYNEIQVDPLSEIIKKFKIPVEIRANSFPFLKKLTLESRGIGVLPNILVKEELKKGELLRVLPQWSHQKSQIQVVYPSSKNLAPRTRAFVDFLAQKKEVFQ